MLIASGPFVYLRIDPPWWWAFCGRPLRVELRQPALGSAQFESLHEPSSEVEIEHMTAHGSSGKFVAWDAAQPIPSQPSRAPPPPRSGRPRAQEEGMATKEK